MREITDVLDRVTPHDLPDVDFDRLARQARRRHAVRRAAVVAPAAAVVVATIAAVTVATGEGPGRTDLAGLGGAPVPGVGTSPDGTDAPAQASPPLTPEPRYEIDGWHMRIVQGGEITSRDDHERWLQTFRVGGPAADPDAPSLWIETNPAGNQRQVPFIEGDLGEDRECSPDGRNPTPTEAVEADHGAWVQYRPIGVHCVVLLLAGDGAGPDQLEAVELTARGGGGWTVGSLPARMEPVADGFPFAPAGETFVERVSRWEPGRDAGSVEIVVNDLGRASMEDRLLGLVAEHGLASVRTVDTPAGRAAVVGVHPERSWALLMHDERWAVQLDLHLPADQAVEIVSQRLRLTAGSGGLT